MTRKCVLIVDDSRTAREVLKKKLTSYDVDIDSVESAGTAVDYLVKKLPDAIFMDFEMPGMDGYQTLRVLKSNTRTSKIPVMMYTSREEGLTVSQARALGAVGVLPKLMGKEEVQSAMEQLNLLTAHESTEVVLEHVEDFDVESSATHEVSEGDAGMEASIKSVESVRNHDQTRKRIARMLAHQHRLINQEFQAISQETRQNLLQRFDDVEGKLSEARLLLDKKAGRLSNGGLLVLLLFLGALIFWSMGKESDLEQIKYASQLAALKQERGRLSDQVNMLEQLAVKQESIVFQQISPLNKGNAQDNKALVRALEWAVNREGAFAYNHVPFGDERVAWLSQVLEHLTAAGFRGILSLRAHMGNFCLQRGDQELLHLADAGTKMSECIFSRDISATEGVQTIVQTIGFSNYLDTTLSLADGTIEVEVGLSGYDDPVAPYTNPYLVENAGVWNKVAAQNQHISVTLTKFQ
ncbi:MAG: response regulator [gamma proteobacterium endosymbiont of Lamellibrachia anaximandri]|nr:response regulator [gamma proteobacterium endosymbiont of Lamellibrachia anaximandri]